MNFLHLYKPIYDNVLEASTLNMNIPLTKAIEEAKMIIEQIPENSEATSDIPLNTTEWKNIAAFDHLGKLARLSESKKWDWSTEAVGSLLIQNLKYLSESENYQETVLCL